MVSLQWKVESEKWKVESGKWTLIYADKKELRIIADTT